jgi:hypothetical protein
LARAKNTQRANARRRHREQVRVNELSDGVDASESDEELDSTEPVAGQARPGGIGSMFSRPRIREDIRAVPDMFRTKKLLWAPFVILLGAFLIVGGLKAGIVPLGIGSVLGIAYALVLQPSALFVPFIGGFLAPRGSYLIGFMIGFVQAVFVSLLLVLGTVREAKLENVPPAWTGVTPIADLTTGDLLSSIVSVFIVCLLFGTVAAAFASWYRNFLRNSQQRAQANRIVREKAAREKAKDRDREQRIAERDARKGAPRKAAP